MTNLNASIMSPSFQEENLSHPTPHSKPVFTSLTSSLDLFSESKLPSKITLSDRITLRAVSYTHLTLPTMAIV